MSKFIELTAKDGSKVLLNADGIFEISGGKHCRIVYKRPLNIDGERYEFECFEESYETVKSLLLGEQKPPKFTAEENVKVFAAQAIIEDDSEEYKEKAKQDMCKSVAKHIYSADLMSFTERGGGQRIKILEGIVRILAPEDEK